MNVISEKIVDLNTPKEIKEKEQTLIDTIPPTIEDDHLTAENVHPLSQEDTQ